MCIKNTNRSIGFFYLSMFEKFEQIRQWSDCGRYLQLLLINDLIYKISITSNILTQITLNVSRKLANYGKIFMKYFNGW